MSRDAMFDAVVRQVRAQGADPDLDCIIYSHGSGMAGEEVYAHRTDSGWFPKRWEFEAVWAPVRGWVLNQRWADEPDLDLPTAPESELVLLAAARRLIRRGEPVSAGGWRFGVAFEAVAAEVERQRAAESD